MSDVVAGTNAAVAAAATSGARMDAVLAYIMHHAADSREWALLPYVKPLHLPPYVTLHGVMLVGSALLLILIFALASRRRSPVPTGMANLLEFFVQFVRDQISIPNLGEEDGRRFTPLFCSFFFFILVTDLVGLIPGFVAATSNLAVTGALAGITLFLMVFGAMYRHGVLGFFKGFIPHGVPWPVLLLMVPIEIISVFIKAMALMIRLFANMLAGHIVLFSLLGLVVAFGAWALPAILLALGSYLLDLFVAIFQAFIFTLLSAVFIGQRYHPAH